jgi:FkbM family methyltransferase
MIRSLVTHPRRSARRARDRLQVAWFMARSMPAAGLISVEVEGALMTIPVSWMKHYVFQNGSEPLSRRFVRSYVGAGMTVLDVGAHVGTFAVLAARLCGRDGHVYAVEPWHANARLLRLNAALNELENLTIIEEAAGAETGFAEFHVTGSHDSHGLFEHPLTGTRETHRVPLRRIDELDLPSPQFVKIDVEGAEISVLQGMDETLRRGKPALLVEWNPQCQRNAGREPLDLPMYLREKGYETLTFLDDRSERCISFDEAAAHALDPDVSGYWYVNIWARENGQTGSPASAPGR